LPLRSSPAASTECRLANGIVQELVRSGFADRTILTIAHRLNTIIDNDKILLMDFGHVAECASTMHLPALYLRLRQMSLVAWFLMRFRYDSPRALLDDYESGFSALVHKLGEENESKLRAIAGAQPSRSHAF
jgi:hypothetical protein